VLGSWSSNSRIDLIGRASGERKKEIWNHW
jgi:hypothetical protein